MTNTKTLSRGWCFTINNYADETIVALKAIECQYLVFGRETAPSTGTQHLQGFVYFDSPKRFSALKKLLPEGAHIEKAKGNCIQNREYCTKDGAFEEQGTLPSQGKRTDIKQSKTWYAKATEYVRLPKSQRLSNSKVRADAAFHQTQYRVALRSARPLVLWRHRHTQNQDRLCRSNDHWRDLDILTQP